MSPIVTLHHYLTVGATVFALGLVGFLIRRNFIVMFLSAEMMLQGVAINFVAFGRAHANLHGQVFVLFLLTVAACEAALALALVLALYRSRKCLDVSVWQDLREANQPPTLDTETLQPDEAEPPLPRLTTAGVEPVQPAERSHV